MSERPGPGRPVSTAAAGARAGARRSAVPAEVGVLDPFVAAGVLQESEVHLAAAVARLVPGLEAGVALAVALAARGPRLGHVCVVLDEVAASVVVDGPGPEPVGLSWPDPVAWRRALASAPSVVGTPERPGVDGLAPLVLDGARLYLQRYRSYEVAVARSLLGRARPVVAGPLTADVVTAAVADRFGPATGPAGPGDAQRRAVEAALGSHLSVIAGGPGTGKTTTITALLQVVLEASGSAGVPPPRVALAAPTGKAAARMTEALGDVLRTGQIAPATTIHRLLGWAPGTEFAHHIGNPLAADLVVVDETSMVDLSLMAHLLDAVRPAARLVLVGDPYQLASVEAGTVLGDVVTAASRDGSPLAPHLRVLNRQHRFSADSAIARLADAVRVGHADAALAVLSGDGASEPPADDAVAWVRDDDRAGLLAVERRMAARGAQVVAAARAGDDLAALEAACAIKLLAATRQGPFGLHAWSERIEAAVADLAAEPWGTLRRGERFYVGKPVLVTANDPLLGVANGDVGVVVAGSDPGERHVAMSLEGSLRRIPPGRLDHLEPWWAMTIHKSQGSEFPEVVVSLPSVGSPILTRELLYTAVTRAKRSVTVVGSEAAIRAAVEHPVARASGLVDRLV